MKGGPFAGRSLDGSEHLIDIRGISRVDSRPASSTPFYNHRERETVCATASYKCTTHRHVNEDQNPARLPLFADFPSSNNGPQMCSMLTVSQICSKLTVPIYTFFKYVKSESRIVEEILLHDLIVVTN